MSAKIFRDPLYNYIGIDRTRDRWLLELLDTSAVQRLRRVHQLGVSNLTYPGADHNRLAHSLGVVHLMQQALQHIDGSYVGEDIKQARAPLLAAALIHDVGHGPFSHLFELCEGADHEVWSKKIILCEDAEIYRVLKKVAPSLPQSVAELIDKKNVEQPAWMRYLLSSQLDVDRLDYLRRDSLFTGAGYGHFDYFRLLNTFEFYDNSDGEREIVWPEKSMLAVEEYIFARYYMYQNVYLHKTTRGFEQMLIAIWKRARRLYNEGCDMTLVPAIRDFWSAEFPTVQQYLRLEEYTVLQQIQNWTSHGDKSINDLARRFLARRHFVSIDPPEVKAGLAPSDGGFEIALHNLVQSKVEYNPMEMYCLKGAVSAKYSQPYFPEKETDEQSVKNAIRIMVGGKPIEISSRLERLKPLTEVPVDRVRYYIPKELHAQAAALRNAWV